VNGVAGFGRLRRSDLLVGAIVAAWLLVYGARAIAAHLALRTNAYDLSVFDYALWSTGRLGLAYVPFMGHSLLSHHFMPTLFLLWLPYQLFSSPVFLMVVQRAAFAGAAVLLKRLLPSELPTLTTMAILVAFLFGRRSHSAIAGAFYPESLEPLLIFGMLLAWRTGGRLAAVLSGLLALGCKEDVAVYVGLFGAVLFLVDSRRRGLVVALGALLWLVLAIVVVIPAARRHDGLPTASPFVETAFGSEAGARGLNRVASGRTLGQVAAVTASAGFLCWLAPTWAGVAVLGLIATHLANPHTMGIGTTGHYLFPVLPWIFFAAGEGAARLHRRAPRFLSVISAALLLVTVADSPLWRSFLRPAEGKSGAAATIRAALDTVPADAGVLAMPNLVPHLAHREKLWTVGGSLPDRGAASYVVLSTVGDLWPLDPTSVRQEIDRHAKDPQFVTLQDGPLYVFQRAKATHHPRAADAPGLRLATQTAQTCLPGLTVSQHCQLFGVIFAAKDCATILPSRTTSVSVPIS
jgi:uncharacterized membrane protein